MDPKSRATLEIPEGAVFELEADGLVIGSRDDVIIRGNIGHRLKKVFSESGSIELRSSTELVVESIESKKGTITIAGAVRAKSVKGAKVQLLEGSLSARSVNAEQSIELRGGSIEADLVMSPNVMVSTTVRGRATVIECSNELGPHQLKGGFKMAEFLEMMPSAQKVIQNEASHLPQLSAASGAPRTPAASMPGIPPAAAVAADGGSPVPQQTWAASARVVEESSSAVEDDAATRQSASAIGENTWFEDQGAPASPQESAAPSSEDTYAGEGEAAMAAAAAEAAAALPDEPEAPAAPAAPERPPFHATLADMCDQIGKVYASQNLTVPPPVQRLTEFVEAGEYAQVKSQLTTIWNQLIQYHKESKLPFAVKTTQMFQSIQRTLASNAPAAS